MHLGHSSVETKSLKSGAGEHEGVGLAPVESGQTGRALPRTSSIADLGRYASTWARLRIDDVPMREPGGRSPSRAAGRRDQDVARVGRASTAASARPSSRRVGKILQAVDRDVDGAFQEGFLTPSVNSPVLPIWRPASPGRGPRPCE